MMMASAIINQHRHDITMLKFCMDGNHNIDEGFQF